MFVSKKPTLRSNITWISVNVPDKHAYSDLSKKMTILLKNVLKSFTHQAV